MNKPDYTYQVTDTHAGKVVSIIDQCGPFNPSLSVTNGVEIVIEEITKELGFVPPYWVYKDTDQRWDAFEVGADGEFLGFRYLGEEVTEEHIAIERVTPDRENT